MESAQAIVSQFQFSNLNSTHGEERSGMIMHQFAGDLREALQPAIIRLAAMAATAKRT
jgi:hypothetical protein